MKERDHISYGFEDIRRYREGLMSKEEMHAFEKASMEDPFLADALEGYMGADMDTAGRHLSENQRRISGNVEDRKKAIVTTMPKRGFSMLRVAAMIILIAGAGLLAYNIFDSDNNQQQTGGPLATVPETKTQENSVLPPDTGHTSLQQEEKPTQPNSPVASARKNADNKEKQSTLAKTTVTGEADQKVAAPVSEGMMANQSNALRDIQVTPLASARSSRTKGTENSRIEPQGGWNAFEQLLAARLPQDSTAARPGTNSARTIELEFETNNIGLPSNIKILRSSFPSLDQAAIEAVRTGPRWMPHNEKIRIAIRFQ